MRDIDVGLAATELLRVAEGALTDETHETEDAGPNAEELSADGADKNQTIAAHSNGSHYIRISIQVHQANQNDDLIRNVSVVIACIGTTTSDVHFLLTDAFTVSDIQYGHYDIGIPFDVEGDRWTPDKPFARSRRPKKPSKFKTMLLQNAQGHIRDCALIELPVKPECETGSTPPMSGDYTSVDDIVPASLFINETDTTVDTEDLQTLLHLFEPRGTFDDFGQFILFGPERKENRKRFEGLLKRLGSRLGG